MGGRGVGGLLVILWMICSTAAVAQTGLLYLDEEPISLEEPIVVEGSTTLVPLLSFAAQVGIEVRSLDGEIVLRGAGFRTAFDEATFPVIDGVAYASLDWMLGLVDGECHRVGGNLYLEIPQARILDVEATPTSITLRLDRYSGYTMTRVEQALSDTLELSWPNCSLGVAGQSIRIGESGIQEVRIAASGNGASVLIRFEAGTKLSIEEAETRASFVLCLAKSDRASTESTIHLTDEMCVVERQTGDGDTLVDFVYVESWRDELRIEPIVSATGYWAADALGSILLEHAATAAVSAYVEQAPTCLIVDGIPYAVPDTPTQVLALDLFGRWATFSSSCQVTLKHAGRMINVDGVNRPIAYGEVVSYAPGYEGDIARGIPGTFLAIKVRENRVVSVYEGPFVPADASALVVVASGDAKARLSLIELGDPIQIVCQFAQAGGGTYRHAVTCGPRLMTDGRDVTDGSEAAEVTSGAILACDWQGGLYLLTFAAGSASSNDATWSILGVLADLPTVVKDAVLLSSSVAPALAYASDTGAFMQGDRGDIYLALGLIPIAP